ncbi:hypothetical protein HPB47_018352, partial [Ixodes persulcatus]
ELAEVERLSTNEKLYLELAMYVSTSKELRDASSEASRMLDEFEVECGNTAAGLHLSPEVQKQVKDLKNEINELSLKFSKAINEENAVLEFTEEELKGLPEEFVKNLDQKAKLLDYETHADFITEILMARNSGNVRRFLTELAEKLQPLWQKEKQLLLQYKKEECESQGIPFDGKLNAWDLSYYKNLVDQEKLRAFFPLDVVTKGLLGIYETLLGLKFDKVEDVKLWHSEAELFKVTDVASQELLGYFLMDLFPREGKYSHFCNIPMQPGCRTADGSWQLPVVGVLCNFPKPTADRPSLLTHNEMLENWCWDLEALRLMSGHYSTGEPIPEDLAKKLMASRLANWSEVYSMDMFDERFKKEGILNPKTGMDYREQILCPGGSVTAEACAAAPARQLCSRLGGSEARALAYGSPCGGFESRPRVLRFAGAVPKLGCRQNRRDERTSRIPTRLRHRRASVASLLVGDDPRRTFSSAENLARDVASMRHRCRSVGRSREAATALSTTPPLDDTG